MPHTSTHYWREAAWMDWVQWGPFMPSMVGASLRPTTGQGSGSIDCCVPTGRGGLVTIHVHHYFHILPIAIHNTHCFFLSFFFSVNINQPTELTAKWPKLKPMSIKHWRGVLKPLPLWMTVSKCISLPQKAVSFLLSWGQYMEWIEIETCG